MQLIRALALALLALPTAAGACDVQISTPGTLGLSGDGRTLSSASGLATIAIISNLNLLSPTTITISNVRLDQTPAGFSAPVTYGGAYSASWLLTGTSGTLAPSASFQVPAILNLVVTLTIHNSVTSTSGFRQGTYTTKTSVTCT